MSIIKGWFAVLYLWASMTIDHCKINPDFRAKTVMRLGGLILVLLAVVFLILGIVLLIKKKRGKAIAFGIGCVMCFAAFIWTTVYLKTHTVYFAINDYDFLGKNIDEIRCKYGEDNFETTYPSSHYLFQDENHNHFLFYFVNLDVVTDNMKFKSSVSGSDKLYLLYDDNGVIFRMILGPNIADLPQK